MSSETMRRLISLCEDVEPKFKEVSPGVWRRVDQHGPVGAIPPVDEGVAEYVWDEEHQGWIVRWLRGPFKGLDLTNKVWRHVLPNTAPPHGLVPKRDGLIYFIEKEDAEKAVSLLVPVFKRTGYEV